MSRDFIPLFPLPPDPRRFHRVNSHAIWDGSNWDDGNIWLPHRGDCARMLVYRPDYSNAGRTGYVRRAWVVWWLATGHAPRKGYDIHHRNENSLDDHFINLEEKEHGKHSTDHHLSGSPQTFTCLTCKQPFVLLPGHIRKRSNDVRTHGKWGKYCSAKCYHATKKQWLKNRPNPHTARLTEAEVKQIKSLLSTTSQHSIARHFNVHVMTIWKIAHGETWRHV